MDMCEMMLISQQSSGKKNSSQLGRMHNRHQNVFIQYASTFHVYPSNTFPFERSQWVSTVYLHRLDQIDDLSWQWIDHHENLVEQVLAHTAGSIPTQTSTRR